MEATMTTSTRVSAMLLSASRGHVLMEHSSEDVGPRVRHSAHHCGQPTPATRLDDQSSFCAMSREAFVEAIGEGNPSV